ncbi:hypothetical protein JG688_00018474, partial [Phytophthora aleatoria]
YSTHEPSPPPSKKTKTIEQSGADESDVSAEYAEPNEFATVVVSNAALREEYEPRRRNSRLLDELRSMENEEYTIGTWWRHCDRVQPFSPGMISTSTSTSTRRSTM